MKIKIFLVVSLIILILLFAGCTEETPRGNVAAPGNNHPTPTPNSTDNTSTTEAPTRDFFLIGESYTSDDGLQITVTRVANMENCGRDDAGCTSVYTEITNNGQKANSAYFMQPVILEDTGNQIELASYGCPNELEYRKDIYPGVIQEGWICFDKISSAATNLKVVLPMGYGNKVNLVYGLPANAIQTAKKTATISVQDLAGEYNGYYTNITGNVVVENTGEINLDDLKVGLNFKQNGVSILEDKEIRPLILYSLAPNKTDQAELSVMETKNIFPGDYNVDFILWDKTGVLTQTTRTLKVIPGTS